LSEGRYVDRGDEKGGDGTRRTSREHDTLLVHTHGVDDSVMTGEVVDEGSFGTFPLFDAAKEKGETRRGNGSATGREKEGRREVGIREREERGKDIDEKWRWVGRRESCSLVSTSTSRRERVLDRVDGESSDTLLVVGEGGHGLSGCEIPKSENGKERTAGQLRALERREERASTNRIVESIEPVMI